MKLVLDLLLVAILLISIVSGYKKGLIMGIGGILVLIVSIVIGNTLSHAYSQEVISAMRPFASGYVDKLLNEGVYDSLGIENSDYSVDDILDQNPSLKLSSAKTALKELGLHEDLAASMAEEAVKYSDINDESLSDGITEVVCSNVAYAVGFVIFFLLAVIILTVIGNLTNLSFRIPYLGIGNEIGGAITGLAVGVGFCLLLAWTLRYMGILFPDGTFEGTHILKFMMEHNILTSNLVLRG